MAKYNINSASGRKRMQRDLENVARAQAQNAIMKRAVPVECPKCKNRFEAAVGLCTCPKCRTQINLKLNFKF